MKTPLRAGLLAVLMPISAAMALDTECSRPEAPAVPDGAKATETQLVDAQEAVQTFVGEGDNYRNCLVAEAKALGEPETPDDEAVQAEYTDEFNDMVEEMQAVGAQFNAAVKAFNAQ